MNAKCCCAAAERIGKAHSLVPDAPPGAEEMRAALQALEGKYRLPLLLHLVEGFEVMEVARMLRLSQGAVKWRIHKGRQLLRATLEQEVRI